MFSVTVNCMQSKKNFIYIYIYCSGEMMRRIKHLRMCRYRKIIHFASHQPDVDHFHMKACRVVYYPLCMWSGSLLSGLEC